MTRLNVCLFAVHIMYKCCYPTLETNQVLSWPTSGVPNQSIVLKGWAPLAYMLTFEQQHNDVATKKHISV